MSQKEQVVYYNNQLVCKRGILQMVWSLIQQQQQQKQQQKQKQQQQQQQQQQSLSLSRCVNEYHMLMSHLLTYQDKQSIMELPLLLDCQTEKP